MKRKLKIMNHQIDQLKEEISSKEAALVREHLEHQRVEKDKDALKAELTRMKLAAADSRAQLEALEMEERKLLKVIAEADAERMRQKKELDQVMMWMMMMMMMMMIGAVKLYRVAHRKTSRSLRNYKITARIRYGEKFPSAHL